MPRNSRNVRTDIFINSTFIKFQIADVTVTVESLSSEKTSNTHTHTHERSLPESGGRGSDFPEFTMSGGSCPSLETTVIHLQMEHF